MAPDPGTLSDSGAGWELIKVQHEFLDVALDVLAAAKASVASSQGELRLFVVFRVNFILRNAFLKVGLARDKFSTQIGTNYNAALLCVLSAVVCLLASLCMCT